ncbi:MAG: hypothetical protein JWN99_2078 [Ilumatobacteraceae bacterium]|nr:hypothetical protein [Ilumatobacteraceae bacterium]
MLLAVTGCGQQNETERATAAPATDAAAPALPDTGTIVVAEAPATVTADVDMGEPDMGAPDMGDDGNVPDTALSMTQAELAGLSVDDPLPPQPDAAADPGGAETAIRFAYGHWILVDLDAELRGHLVENGEEHADGMAAKMSSSQAGLDYATIGVDSVTFIDAQHADVMFQVYWLGQPSPVYPEPRRGAAVLQDGTWRVAAATVCLLAVSSGLGCALQDDGTNPTQPSALHVGVVPPGLQWLGAPGSRDVVNLDNRADWGVDDHTWMTISVNSRPGISHLSAVDADAMLTQYAGGSGTVKVTIAGSPARYYRNEAEQSDGSIDEMFWVVAIRPDDVIVQVNASRVPIDDVIAAIASLTPTGPAPATTYPPPP